MSPSGRSEQVGALRTLVARLEGGHAPQRFALRPARPNALAPANGLDLLLRGGLSRGTLIEVVAAAAGDGGAASGFALGLAARFAADGGSRAPVIWIMEQAARRDWGAPYGPGLAAHGLALDRLLLVQTRSATDALGAAEEALKCRAVAAVVVELWRLAAYDLVASRRLLLAAAAGGVPAILVPMGASDGALSSAAHARFRVAAAPGPPVATGARLPLPGRAAWAVRLARIRAGPAGLPVGFDQDKIWPLVWDHQEARLRDALPVPPSALPRHRPDRAADRGRLPGGERAA